jgi:hypothetical protein
VDRKKLAEHGLQAHIVAALADRDILLEKLVVGIDLEFDEVGWLYGLLQFAEVDAFRHGVVRWRVLVRLAAGGFYRPGFPETKTSGNAGRRGFARPGIGGKGMLVLRKKEQMGFSLRMRRAGKFSGKPGRSKEYFPAPPGVFAFRIVT